MPRRKKSKITEAKGSPETPHVKPPPRKPVRKTKDFDASDVVEQIRDVVIQLLGLDQLGVNEELSSLIVQEVAESLVSSYSSKPKPDAVVKKLKRNLNVYRGIAAHILIENVEKPTLEQLEYIVRFGERAAIGEIGKFYKLAVEHNREDIIMALKNAWSKYGPKYMVECPRCGFNSIAPDYACIVCGNVVTEKYIREKIGFEEKFIMYVKSASVAELRDVVSLGFVLANQRGVFYPRSKNVAKVCPCYTISLTAKEISVVMEEINSRDLQV